MIRITPKINRLDFQVVTMNKVNQASERQLQVVVIFDAHLNSEERESFFLLVGSWEKTPLSLSFKIFEISKIRKIVSK